MHEAFLQVAGDEGGAFRAALLEGFERIHAQLAFDLLGAVALDAVGLEDRGDDLRVIVALLAVVDDGRRRDVLLRKDGLVRLEGESISVLQLATDMGREAHHPDGHDLTDEAKQEALGEEEAGDTGKDRGGDAAPEMELHGVAFEAVEVGVEDAAEDGTPGACRREDGQAAHGRRCLFVALEEFEHRHDEQHRGRDVQGEDVEVAKDGQDGRAALSAVGGQGERQADKDQVGDGDEAEGLPEAEAAKTFFDAMKGVHGAERVGRMWGRGAGRSNASNRTRA